MASKPGILTDWPWKPLGSFKYVILAPSVVHSLYSMLAKDKSERDITNFLILPFLLWRMLHNQIWITLSRHRTAKGNGRIVDKGIEFDQVDRERNWDDQILLTGLTYYLSNYIFAGASRIPLWRTDAAVVTILLHMGPVEFLYYWLHRALHHHFLYSRYHSHHHSSIVTEPITSVIHPFAEHISYLFLFATPLLTLVFTKTASMMAVFGYVTYIDFMNNMGHCNFEIVPMWLFNIFPCLKYLMYTPSFHSLHHTQFKTNYSLFMPFYDYIYDTLDKASDQLHDSASKREEEIPDVVHLTHLTTPESIYHLRLGFAYLACKPCTSKWYLCLMWPMTAWSMILTLAYGRTFIVEGNHFDKLKLQSWAIPKYSQQYFIRSQKMPINKMIEEAILDADKKGIKVLSLGLLNQGEDLNSYGGFYVSKHPNLKVKVIDGSSLATAIVLNSIPNGTTQVLLRGKLTKVAYTIAFTLCQQGVQVATMHKDDYVKLKNSFSSFGKNLIIEKSYTQKTWLVGEGLTEEEQLKAPKGTLFITYSQFPPIKYRKDCSYHFTPAMLVPSSIQNVHSCENWLPRKVMSAWRIAGIVHCLEGWSEHECNYTMHNIDKTKGFQTVEDSTNRYFKPFRCSFSYLFDSCFHFGSCCSSSQMDRSWMNESRISPEYEEGVEQFLQFASERGQPDEDGKYYCPCINCLNGRRQILDDIREHLLCDGIKRNYTTWIWHGEMTDMQSGQQSEPFDVEMGDRLEDMIRDLGQESFQQAHAPVYERLQGDSKKPLYPGCNNSLTLLSAVLSLVNVKARYGWSDKFYFIASNSARSASTG